MNSTYIRPIQPRAVSGIVWLLLGIVSLLSLFPTHLALAARTGRASASQAAAPMCGAPQWDLDSGGGVNLHCWNNIYVVSVDLRSPDVEVVPLEVNRPTALSQLGDGDTIAIINGDYTNNTCSGTRCAQGLFSIAGEDKTNQNTLCTDALKRRVLAISADGRPLIDWWYALISNPQSRCPVLRESGGWATGARYHVISGGPQITFDGQYRWNAGPCNGTDYIVNEEHFKCDAAGWTTGIQTVAGYTSDGNRLMFAVSTGKVEMQSMHDVLWSAARHHGQALQAALKYDGGSKSGLFYRRNTSYSIQPDAPVANAWVVRRRHTNTQPPCAPSAEQVALYSGTSFSGACKVLNIGEYADPGAFAPVGNDDTRSIRVGANVQALLYQNAGFDPAPPTTLTSDVADLSATAVRYGTSSIKVQRRTPPPAPPTLVAPASGSTMSASQGVNLAWSATGDEYYGEIWGGPGGARAFGWQAPTSRDIGPQQPGTYSWHVKARNGAGESGWSETSTFTITSADCPAGQFRAEYYNNRDLGGGPALLSCEDRIDRDWGWDGPGNEVPTDGFSARWTGRFSFDAARYVFNIRADDGIRVWLDGSPLIDAWIDQPPTEYHAEREIAGGVHDIVVEYYENGGIAVAQVEWLPSRVDAASRWSADQWQNVSSLAFDGGVSRSGTRAARITSAVENDARWTQRVVVAPHTRYILSGWVKTEQVREDLVGANLGLVDDWTRTADLRGTHDWTYVQTAIDSGDRTELWIGARLGHWNNTTTGTAWFDDLALQELTPSGLGANLLQDAGFEPPHWVPDQSQLGSSFAIDSAVAHQGDHAARITSAAANDARWTQLIKVNPNSQYILSGWIKTDGVAPIASGASLGLVDSLEHTADIRGTQDWTYVEMTIDSGNRSDLWVGAWLGHQVTPTTGTAWFDDLALQEVTAGGRGPNLLQNAGFED